jgi:hypothetical protein
MVKRRLAWLLAGLVLAAGCSDRGLPLDPITAPPPSLDTVGDSVGAPPEEGVGTLGTIDEIKPQGQGLVLYQTGFDVEEVPGARIRQSMHKLSVGARHQKLQVQIKDSTEIWVQGRRVTVDSLAVGMEVLVVGRVTGAALHAEVITDLSDAQPPSDSMTAALGPMSAGPVSDWNPELGVRTTSMCLGQTLPYSAPDILQFQGCWGGPSAAGSFPTGFIPVFCPLIGCVGIDQFSYVAGLAGWGYAFPFQFEATSPANLVYNIPADVTLKVTPLSADPALSFWGGLGLEFGLRFRFCSFFGCYNLGTVELSVLTTIQQSSGAAPLGGQVLDIATTSCPSVGLIPLAKVPIDPLSLGFCQDLDLHGRDFRAMVRATGANPAWSRYEAFGPQPITRSVRPSAMNVDLRFDNFHWVPELHQSYFFRLDMFIWTLWNSPKIPLPGAGPFEAITTPFPLAGSVFTVATDPLSPVDALRYFYHPTTTRLSMDVDPAPTLLTITSSALLSEGSAVTAWLREEYLNAPISGHPVTLEATGLAGTPSTTVTAVTDGTGTVALILPPGEYRVTATFAGAEMYVPSQDTMDPVYVYRPTTFVIWGGNPGGIVTGGRYQFWGSGWSKQVVGGDYGGNASFQGFSIQESDVLWSSPPASSGNMPADVPDLISVIVTTRVTRRGTLSTGNIAGHAILRVENPERYRPAGGHALNGVVRVVLDGRR